MDQASARDVAAHEPGVRAQPRRRMDLDLGRQRLHQQTSLARVGCLALRLAAAFASVQRLDRVAARQLLPVGARKGLVGEELRPQDLGPQHSDKS